jgi:hypothetical protein
MLHSSAKRWRYGRLSAGIASLAAMAAFGVSAIAADPPAASRALPQATQMTFGASVTTTTPPTIPATASAAPVVKAPKVKGF